MNLYEVLKYKQDSKGRDELTYKKAPTKGDVPKDDEYFQDITKSMNPGSTKIKPFTKDDVSVQEVDYLKGLKKEGHNFQPMIPISWASTIHGTKGKSADFLDALKDRNKDKVSFKGMNDMIEDMAKAVLRELPPLKSYKTAIVTDLPSTKGLASQFAKEVAKQLQQQGIPTAFDNLFVKNPDRQTGTILRGAKSDETDEDGFPVRPVTFRPEAYGRMLQLARQSGEEGINKAIDYAEQRKEAIKKQANDSNLTPDMAKAIDEEAQYIDKYLDKILELDPNAEQKEVQTKQDLGFIRRLVYKRFAMNPEAATSKESTNEGKTLIVIADDNFDSRRSVLNAYYELVENGYANYPSSAVVAVAMHQMRGELKGKE